MSIRTALFVGTFSLKAGPQIFMFSEQLYYPATSSAAVGHVCTSPPRFMPWFPTFPQDPTIHLLFLFWRPNINWGRIRTPPLHCLSNLLASPPQSRRHDEEAVGGINPVHRQPHVLVELPTSPSLSPSQPRSRRRRWWRSPVLEGPSRLPGLPPGVGTEYKRNYFTGTLETCTSEPFQDKNLSYHLICTTVVTSGGEWKNYFPHVFVNFD